MVRNAIYSSVVSAVGTLPDAIRSGWEAETGPPLTSVGLSASCNRKWEKIERERRKKNTDLWPLQVESLDNSSDCTCKYTKLISRRVSMC